MIFLPALPAAENFATGIPENVSGKRKAARGNIFWSGGLSVHIATVTTWNFRIASFHTSTSKQKWSPEYWTELLHRMMKTRRNTQVSRRCFAGYGGLRWTSRTSKAIFGMQLRGCFNKHLHPFRHCSKLYIQTMRTGWRSFSGLSITAAVSCRLCRFSECTCFDLFVTGSLVYLLNYRSCHCCSDYVSTIKKYTRTSGSFWYSFSSVWLIVTIFIALPILKKRKPANWQASIHVNDILRRSTPSFAEAKHTRS